MKSEKATLDDLEGTGYAEMHVDHSGRKSYRGVFYSDNLFAGHGLMSPDKDYSVFSGTLYVNGLPHQLSFEVIVTESYGSSDSGTTAEFIARKNPFEESE